MNRVVLLGYLVKKPELRYRENNMAIATFSLGVARDFKDKDGKINKDFINIVCFNKTAENTCSYCDEGSKVIVEGEIRTSRYEKDGKTSYNTQIVANKVRFLTTKGNSTPKQENASEVPKNESKLNDKQFEEFGNQIEIDDIGF